MNTLEAIATRRSIRAFTSDPVSEADMESIVRAAAAAPSGGNRQMWVFISIRDPRRLMAVRALSPGISNVPPALIVICLDRRHHRTASDTGLKEMCGYDLGAAMQNILLAAHELGLGGCAIGSFNPEGLSTLLNLPAEIEPVLLVTLGKPRFMPPAPKRRPIEEVHYKEKYGGVDG